jgi:hypothetical protein
MLVKSRLGLALCAVFYGAFLIDLFSILRCFFDRFAAKIERRFGARREFNCQRLFITAIVLQTDWSLLLSAL